MEEGYKEEIKKQIVEKLELINDVEILNYINIIVSDIVEDERSV